MGNVTHLQIEGEIREHDEGSTYLYLGRGIRGKRLASPKLYFPKKKNPSPFYALGGNHNPRNLSPGTVILTPIQLVSIQSD